MLLKFTLFAIGVGIIALFGYFLVQLLDEIDRCYCITDEDPE